MLVDSHCHIDYPDFEHELPACVARAREAGVGLMLNICCVLDRVERARAVVDRFPEVLLTVGVHPDDAASWTPDVDRLIALAQHDKTVGLGETGLDYFHMKASKEVQAASFRAHIEAARHTGLPLVIHSRDSDDDMLAILREEMGKGAFTGVLHCFTSGEALGLGAAELGLYVSISGVATFKKAEPLREIIRKLPLSQLLVETDAPYLTPEPVRGRRNEPAFVAHVAARMATLFGVGKEEFARQTTDNFFRLFPKAEAFRPAGKLAA